jgi:hypothetical protein
MMDRSCWVNCSYFALADSPRNMLEAFHHLQLTHFKQMCIRLWVQYSCGHAEMDFMNHHCRCALIVGPALDSEAKCKRFCGGSGGVEVAEKDVVEEESCVVDQREDQEMCDEYPTID